MSNTTVKIYDTTAENKEYLQFPSKYINNNRDIESFEYPIDEEDLLKELSRNGVILIKNTDEVFKQECLNARKKIAKKLEQHHVVKINKNVKK